MGETAKTHDLSTKTTDNTATEQQRKERHWLLALQTRPR
jgi:hypothetical protein